MAKKVVGTLSADGAFELHAAGLSGAMLRGKKQGEAVQGDLLVSVWGEGTDYVPRWRRPAFTFLRKPLRTTLDGGWSGMIGKDAVRMSFTRTADRSAGQALYAHGEVSSLEAKDDWAGERLIIEKRRGAEPRGRIEAVLNETYSAVLGTWTSADGSRSAFVALASGRAAPPAVTLSASLRNGAFGLELSHYADGNGAHGLGSGRCLLVDPASARIVEPRTLIHEGKRQELTRLVTRKLLAQNSVKSMAELRQGCGGSEDGPDEATVSAETDICLTDKSVDVAFEVYEIGPYSMNAPRVSLAYAEARPFFAQDELLATLLR
jgi:hypothetical protein